MRSSASLMSPFSLHYFGFQTLRVQRLWFSATTDAAPLHSGSGRHRGDVLLRVSHVHRLPAPPVQGELPHNMVV